MHQCRAFAYSDEFVILIESTVLEYHDAVIRPRPGILEFEDFGLNANRIAVKQWLWKTNIVPTKIRDRRSHCRVTDRNTDHKTQGQAAIDQRPAEFGGFAVLRINVQRRRVVGERAEPDVVSFRNGAVDWVLESLTNFEFFEIETGHQNSPECGW